MHQAANLLGITSAQLSRYVKTGAIRKWSAPNSRGSAIGSYRFDPSDLERLESALADEAEASEQPTTADTVRASVEGLKQAQAHAERLVNLFEEPYKRLLDSLHAEIAALSADNKELRAERVKLEELREEVRSTRAAETIALEQLRSEQATKAEAIAIGKPIVQHFVNAALLKGGVDPRMIALKDAVAGIPRDTLAALFSADLLPADVIEKLKFGLNWEEPKAAAE